MTVQAGHGKLDPSAAEARPETTTAAGGPAPRRRVGTDPNQDRDEQMSTTNKAVEDGRDGPASGDRRLLFPDREAQE